MAEQRDAIHDAATLLPWYVSGTLAPEEAHAVEQHLAACGGCREEAERWRRFRRVLGTTVESRPAPAPELFASVISRIDASEAASARFVAPRVPWWERLAAAVFGFFPPRLAPAAALAVIVLQFGVLAVVGTVAYRAASGPSAVTQSSPESLRPLAPGAVRLRVAFEETAPEGEIRVLLQRLDARIVDGPSAAGFYIVEAPAAFEGRPVVDTLAGDAGLIRFVEQLSR